MNTETEIPNLKREDEREEKKGILASLLAKLGLAGVEAGSGAYPAAIVGSNAFWAGLLASKAGIMGLIVAGTTAAAGIGYGIYSNVGLLTPPSPEDVPGLVFEQGVAQKTRDAGSQNKANPDGVSDSLSQLREANQAPPSLSAAAPAAGNAAPAATAHANAVAPVDNTTSSGGGAAKPAMVPTPSLAGSNSSLSSGAMAQQSGLSGGVGGNFSGIYRKPGQSSSFSSGARTSAAGSSRTFLGAGGSRAAMGQLGATNRVVSSNAHSPAVSSQGSGATYDGAKAGIAANPGGGDISGGGAGLGGSGVSSNPTGKANPTTQPNQIPPAPAPGPAQNKTPWQWAQNVAMGALGLALLAFVAMYFFKKKVLTGGPTAPMWLTAAKIAAGIATAAAAVATAMGITIMTTYGQMMQGGLWTGIGGLFTAAAAYSLYDLFTDRDLQMKAEAGAQAEQAAAKMAPYLQDHGFTFGDWNSTTGGYNVTVPNGVDQAALTKDLAGAPASGTFSFTPGQTTATYIPPGGGPAITAGGTGAQSVSIQVGTAAASATTSGAGTPQTIPVGNSK